MNRRNWLAAACVIGLAATVSGCDTKKVFGCMPVDDPWKTPPGQRDGINDLTLKPYTIFVPVPEDKVDTIAPKLKKKAFILLTDKDLAAVGVTAPAEAAGLTPYLMRAVSSRQAGGKYVMTYMEDEAWVRYVRTDKDTCAPMFHEAVIAWLPKPPVAVFATASINE